MTAHQRRSFCGGVDSGHRPPRAGRGIAGCGGGGQPGKTTPGYPGGELAGVGVAFKLLQGLAEIIPEVREVLWKNLDLVAVGTVADIVPLTGENRLLVKEGLKVLGKTENPGLSALLDLSGWAGREITPGMISFGLAPRLNACGRLGSGQGSPAETDRNRPGRAL